MTVRVGWSATAPEFSEAAKISLKDSQLRRNLRNATDTIRAKRARVVNEMADWEALRQAASEIKAHTMRHLDRYLLQFEENVIRAGGHVHWARDADEANGIVADLLQGYAAKEVIKVKAMTTDEIQLNRALESRGILPYETDLAELILQLSEDKPSHIVVPALHKNRHEIREIFIEKMSLEKLGEEPNDLADAARLFLRKKFLSVKIGLSGANFAIAENGALVVLESEGNGRMCLTLPDVLISVLGIEKVIPTFQDLEEAAPGARVARRTLGVAGVDDAVAVAVGEDADHGNLVATHAALLPELPARAAPERGAASVKRGADRGVGREGKHPDLAGDVVLNDGRDESLCVVLQRGV